MKARQPSITLKQFVEQQLGNVPAAEELVTTFLDALPPSQLYFPKSKHVAKEYLSKKPQSMKASMFGFLVEAAVNSLLHPAKAADIMQLLDILGFVPQTIPEKFKMHLFLQAALYQLTKNGNCAFRSCYASICLFNIFKGTNIGVTVQSDTRVDHYIVTIGNKECGYFHYDPTTNPSMIYESGFYKTNILNTFSLPPHAIKPNLAMNLKVTAELATDYAERFPRMEETFLKLIQAQEYTVEALCHDDHFIMLLQVLKAHKRDYEKHAAEAIGCVKELLEKPRQLTKKL